MENVVLGLLIIQSLTLYELNRAFKQGISMFYSASYGSLQVAVKNLVAKGLIVFEEKVEHGRNKKVYSITAPGRKAFFQWMFAEIPANKLEVTALSRVYFLGLIPDLAGRRQVVLEILRVIELVQAGLGELNAEISRIAVPDEYRAILHYQFKTLDYGLGAHVFARQWFADLLVELESGSDPPCVCLDSPLAPRTVSAWLGMDESYRETTILACPACGRSWLRLHQEDEAFTASGRWYLGEIGPEQIPGLTAQNARAIIEGLSWYFYGGSYFDGKIGKASGTIW